MSKFKSHLYGIIFIIIVLLIFYFFILLVNTTVYQQEYCNYCKIITNKERVITEGNWNYVGKDYCRFAFSDNTSKKVTFGEYSNYFINDTFCFKQIANKSCE